MTHRSCRLFVAAVVLFMGGCAGGDEQKDRTGFVYVANSGPASNSISMFSMDPSTGALESLGALVSAGTQPQQVVIDTSGRFAFVSNLGSQDLGNYLINPSGILSSLGSAIAVEDKPGRPTIDPLNRFLFVPNSGSDSLSVFTVNNSGVLTPVGGAPFPTERNPGQASIDSQGRFVWVNNLTDGTISMYFLNAPSGVLTAAPGSPLDVGLNPQQVTFQTVGSKLIAYVANAGSGNISAFEVNQDIPGGGGIIREVQNPPIAAGTSPNVVTIDPGGRFALVSNAGSGSISVYQIDASTGGLDPAPTAPFVTGETPQQVTIHPGGSFAYVSATISGSGGGSVYAYSIDQSTGVLTQITGSPFVTGGTQPQRVTIDSAGKFAFVSNKNSGTISVFSINQTSGVLSPVVGSPFATGNSPEQATLVGTF